MSVSRLINRGLFLSMLLVPGSALIADVQDDTGTNGIDSAAEKENHDTPASEAQVEEVVVRATGSRLPPSVISFPGSVTVIEQEELAQQTRFNSDLARVLAFEVPGLATSSFSSSNFDQRLRGRKVAVYIDGIPVSAPLRDAGRDFRVLDASAIGGVEVIRGSTALYGSGGAGGSINYLTKTPSGDDGWSGSSELTLGGSLTHLSDSFSPLFRQNLEYVSGPFDSIFAGSYEQYDGFFDADGDRIPANPDGNGGVAESRIFNIYTKVGYNWEDQRIEASYLQYDQDQDSDYLLKQLGDQSIGLKTTALYGQVDPRDEQDFNQNLVAQVSYRHENILGGSMRLQYYIQNSDQQFAWNSSRAGGSNSRIESEKDGIRLDFVTPVDFLGEGSVVMWGSEYATDKSVQTVNSDPVQVFVPELEQTDFALFMQMVAEVTDRLTIQGGVRYDDLSLDLEDYTVLGSGLEVMGSSTDYSSTVLNAGAAFQINEQFAVFGGYSQGFSLPDVGRVLRSTTDTNPLVNIKPVPVEIDNYELGVRMNFGEINATLAGFFNTSDLGELFVPDPNSPPGVLEYIVTRQAQDFWGIEATVSGPLFEGCGRWGSSFTWIDGEQDTDGDGDPDGPIENTSIPPVKVTAFADYAITDDWALRVQLLYSGDRNEFPDIAETSRGDHGHVRSYWTLDASTSFQWGPGRFTVAVSNLLNKQYFPTSSLRSGNRPERYSAAPGAVARVGYTLTY